MTDKIYNVRHIVVTPQCIQFEISGNRIEVPLAATGSTVLPTADSEYLQLFEVDVDGIGIYWPALDEDLSIEGLLRSANRNDLIVKNIPSVYLDDEDAEKAPAPAQEETIH